MMTGSLPGTEPTLTECPVPDCGNLVQVVGICDDCWLQSFFDSVNTGLEYKEERDL